jgi:hypothetical protein
MAMNAVTLQAALFAAMQAKGWQVTVTTPDGSITPTSLNDLAEVIAKAVVDHITGMGLATIPPATVVVAVAPPGVATMNPLPIPLVLT